MTATIDLIDGTIIMTATKNRTTRGKYRTNEHLGLTNWLSHPWGELYYE